MLAVPDMVCHSVCRGRLGMPQLQRQETRTETLAERQKGRTMNDDWMREIDKRANLATCDPTAQPTCAERGRAICEEALRTINGERQDAYGHPEDSFKPIAALWEAYLGTKVTPPMVADMMCLLKIARENGGKGKRDNMVDLIGYAALAARMRGYDE